MLQKYTNAYIYYVKNKVLYDKRSILYSSPTRVRMSENSKVYFNDIYHIDIQIYLEV